MQAIIRKRLQEKKGFTLIEVIVVLVILAILAAIAVPALTGYIDEANERAAYSEGHTVLVALQALVTEDYADNTPSRYFTNGTTGTTGIADSVGKSVGTVAGVPKFKALSGLANAPLVNTVAIKDKVIIGFEYTTSGGKTIIYDKTNASGLGEWRVKP